MPQKLNKLKNLLNETPEAYYWLGFLLADGHFSKTNRLLVGLSDKDHDHLIKLSNFLGVNPPTLSTNKQGYGYTNLRVMDVTTVAILKERYSIDSNKTYNPPILDSIKEDNLFALMIGFIDGDGSIKFQSGRTDCKLSVKCHSNWQNLLSFIFKVTVRINNAGYAYFCISDNEKLRSIYRKVLKLGLPVMERKWSLIDLERVSRYATSKIWQTEAIQLYKEGKNYKEIMQITGQKYITIYMAIHRNKGNI